MGNGTAVQGRATHVTVGSDRLPGTAGSPAEARRFVAALAAARGFDPEDAALVASELATNAVEHARSSFLVEVSVTGPLLRIEVSDDSREPPALAAEDQWGLRIVEAVSRAWGCYPTTTGKTVWAELGE